MFSRLLCFICIPIIIFRLWSMATGTANVDSPQSLPSRLVIIFVSYITYNHILGDSLQIAFLLFSDNVMTNKLLYTDAKVLCNTCYY